MTLHLDRLSARSPVVDAQGKPTPDFHRLWQKTVEALERQEAEQDQAIADIASLLDAVIDLNDLLTTQGADIAAVEAATIAAQAAADAANAAAEASAAQTALQSSYPDGATITATDAGASVTISIAAHTRRYPQADGSTVSVSVNGGSVTGLSYATAYWIYYDDAAHAGGAVTYHATTVPETGAQIGDRHAIGAVTTPAAAAPPAAGKILRAPGVVLP